MNGSVASAIFLGATGLFMALSRKFDKDPDIRAIGWFLVAVALASLAFSQ